MKTHFREYVAKFVPPRARPRTRTRRPGRCQTHAAGAPRASGLLLLLLLLLLFLLHPHSQLPRRCLACGSSGPSQRRIAQAGRRALCGRSAAGSIAFAPSVRRGRRPSCTTPAPPAPAMTPCLLPPSRHTRNFKTVPTVRALSTCYPLTAMFDAAVRGSPTRRLSPTAHSAKAHDWMVSVLGPLFRTAGHKVRTQHGQRGPTAQRCGDSELSPVSRHF